jgi:hypothetical protein
MGFAFATVYVVDMISHSDILVLTSLQPALNLNTDQDGEDELLFGTQVRTKFLHYVMSYSFSLCRSLVSKNSQRQHNSTVQLFWS